MAIPLKTRQNYQPQLRGNGIFHGGERNYLKRLAIIEHAIDFNGKTVIDLGCSSGFFSFSLARKAKHVIAVDADPDIISQNKEMAARNKFKNISFLCQTIDEELISALPPADVVLFLSVFHHIIADSRTYTWSPRRDTNAAIRILSGAAALGQTFVFEMGSPDEGFAWCSQMASLSRELPGWIRTHAFKHDFSSVQALKGPAFYKFPFNNAPGLRDLVPANRWGRVLLRLLRVDVRDFRTIYVGSRDARYIQNFAAI